ncbi:MAG: hypothetical protein M3507_04110 [Actinomycetota bacterium]|nr:hypothetical protein [Actinomycetota bacterium]
MKKVLVGTCVLAMAAFGITNASADPVSSARGNAFAINVDLLGDGLIEREPEVTSVLGDGRVSEDVITPEAEPVTVAGTGVVVADTSVESSIIPFTFDGGEALRGEGGTSGSEEGLIGGIFDDLLGGGGGGGGTLGGVLNNSAGDANTVQAQQLGDTLGGGGGGGEGTLGGLIGGDLIGGLLDSEDDGGEIGSDDEIKIPFVNALGFARIEDLNLVTEDGGDSVLGPLDSLETEVKSLLIDALLEIDAVTAEAVAVCVGQSIFFDTSSNILALNNEPVSLVDDLLDSVSEATQDLGLLEIATNERFVDEATGTVGVNALRITLLDDLGGDLIGGGEDDPTDPIDPTDPVVPIDPADPADTTDPDPADTTDPDTTETTLLPELPVRSFQAQQLGGGDDEGGDDPALEIIIGHAEVSGNVCAQQAAPPAPLVPAGDDRTLPVTGGGLGVLPAVLSLGLAGGALAAGRLALRSRREHTL